MTDLLTVFIAAAFGAWLQHGVEDPLYGQLAAYSGVVVIAWCFATWREA